MGAGGLISPPASHPCRSTERARTEPAGAVHRRGPFTGGSPRARGGGAAHGEPRPRSRRRRSRSIRRRRHPERGGSSAPHPPWAAGSDTAAASRCRGRGFTPCAGGCGDTPQTGFGAWGGGSRCWRARPGLAERSRDAALAPEQVRAGGK